jgi:Zn-dependent peptidase ImmA (M78 family)/DNA-binding XRE family transcriptional regulator
MAKINYRMIELGRLSRAYTQKDLASLLPHINQSNLSKIEKGQLNVTDETLIKIAEALNYPISFFYQDELKTPFSNIYFRKRTTIPQKALDKIFADVKIILKSIDNLLNDVELTEYSKYSFDITNGWTPEAAAIRLRELFKIPSGPIKNLVKALEDEGIIVYFYDCPEEKFDGLTAYTDRGYPVIFVNKNMPNDRIRYTLCHELGHLVLHIPCDVEPWRNVEDEANLFAAEFLMPSRDCSYDLQSLSFNNLAVLKAYWGVSKAAIIRRGKTLNLISEATYVYMMKELGRRNERKNESGFVDVDEPNILKEVVVLLKSELNYSEESLSESLNLNTNDYCKFFEDSKSIKVKVRAIRQAI